MPNFVKIAIPIPSEQLFTYSIEGIEEDNLIGKRAIIPFGNKIITGFILEYADSSEFIKTKNVIEVIDEEPIFNENIIKLAYWIADYYLSTIGETLKAILPTGMTVDSNQKIKWIRKPNDSELAIMSKKAPIRTKILQTLFQFSGFVSIDSIEKIIKTNISKSQIDWLEKNKYIDVSNELSKLTKAKTLKAVKIPQKFIDNDELLAAEITTIEKRSPKAALVITKIFENQINGKISFIKDLSHEFNYNSLQTLAKKEFIEIYEEEVELNFSTNKKLSNKNEAELKLTNEQQTAAEEISKSIENEEFKAYLLHGVTGSGKTLVYIDAIKKVINQNKQAILMVPEISLTPQLIDRFTSIFGNRIAVLHSSLTKTGRFESWKMIYENRADLIIGARSALFAPASNLGIIIVDEEHEATYKQDSPSPRYNGRDCAIIRGMIEKCPVVLGSATPSLESMFNALTGKYKLLEIKHRADGAEMPSITAVNSLDATKNGLTFGSFSKSLLDEVEKRIKLKEGTILLQNRRGYSNLLQCRACGDIPKCDSCSVSLTYHITDDTLRCHYCGYKRKRDNCKNCGSQDLRQLGTGTQKIEDELSQYFTPKSIEFNADRFDLDTTSKKGATRDILFNFATQNTDILIGTQMVAKGIDFHHVTLVGVLNADLQLNIPDFRSNERTFQLLTQVSGRAGRSGDKKGKVIIQSSNPDNPIIKAVINNDYSGFYKHEIAIRKHAQYPPFYRFIKIEFSGSKQDAVRKAASDFYKLIPNIEEIITFEPVEPVINKIKNNFRRLIIIKNDKQKDKSGNLMRAAIKFALEKFRNIPGNSSVKLFIDIDAGYVN